MRRLPSKLLPPGLRQRLPEANGQVGPLLDLEPIRQLVAILQDLPGFDPQILLRRLPRLLAQPDLRGMGLAMAKGLAERGVVRLLRDVLVSPA
jgi:hypothetical protein